MSVDPESGSPQFLERLDPNERRDHQAAQHWARYEWAARFLPAKRVLDCSCGLGYGSALLRARGAEHVVGVDIDAEAVRLASERYGRDGVEYLAADALSLDPANLGPFSLIVSLETIEHVRKPERLLDVFRALLEDRGILALSCPNDRESPVKNPFHLWHATYVELLAMLTARFAHVASFGEFHTSGAAVWPAEAAAERPDPARVHPAVMRPIGTLAVSAAPVFLFACSDRPLPEVPPVASELLDGNAYIRDLERVRDDLWEESRRLARAWEEQRARIEELERLRIDLASEGHRLAAVWETQNARIGELEAEKVRLWEEAQRLASVWEAQNARIGELEAEKVRLWEEAQRLAKAWAEQAAWIKTLEQGRRP